MAFVITDTVAGTQQIADTSTTKKHPLGTIVRAKDASLGEGEFIYLLGVTSTIVGSIVEYDTSFQSGLESTALSKPRPNAVAMSINVGSAYGWYQISGLAKMAKLSTTSFAAAAALAASSGLAIAAATGIVINGALVAVVKSATSVTAPDLTTVMINRPSGPAHPDATA